MVAQELLPLLFPHISTVGPVMGQCSRVKAGLCCGTLCGLCIFEGEDERAVNLRKIQSPGTTVKFGGGVWSGKTHVVSETVTNTVQASTMLNNVKEVQEFVGILELLSTFSPHMAPCLNPLFELDRPICDSEKYRSSPEAETTEEKRVPLGFLVPALEGGRNCIHAPKNTSP